MRYIQFFHNSTGYVPGSIPPRYDAAYIKPIPALGSENSIPLDGRLNKAHCLMEAASLATSPRYHRAVGYQLMQGANFSDARPWSAYVPL